jgi:hypothetical protein
MHTLLTPVLALIAWTLIVWLWMLGTRIPAMQAARIRPQDAQFTSALSVLPPRARGVADNYNHLMEQPTIFYAMVFYIVLAGHTDQIHIWLAWIYVALRIVHSLIQNTVNIVTFRFAVFALSTLALAAMAVREVLALL